MTAVASAAGIWGSFILAMCLTPLTSKTVNLGPECSSHLACGPGEINRSRVNHIDRKTVRLEPRGDDVEVLWGKTELFV